MVYCVAYGCTNCSNGPTKNASGVTFHRFPKNEEHRRLWVKAVQRENWTPTQYSRLCSVHFTEDMIDRTSLSCVRLRENAVPTIFETVPQLLQKQVGENRKPSTGMAIDSNGLKENMVADPFQPKKIETPVLASKSESLVELLGRENDPSVPPSVWLLVPTNEESENEALEEGESSEKEMLPTELIVENNEPPLNWAISSSSTNMVHTGKQSENDHSYDFGEIKYLKRKLMGSQAKNKEYAKSIKVLRQKIRRQEKRIERLTSLTEKLKCQEREKEEILQILDTPGQIAGIIYVLKQPVKEIE